MQGEKENKSYNGGYSQERRGSEAEDMIHSFIPDISIAQLQVHYYSEALSTTALLLCPS